MIWGSIDASGCATEFTFGSEGKPLYVSGPYDSLERSKEIIATLLERRGQDGFHYLVGDPAVLGEHFAEFPDEDDDEEFEEDDEAGETAGALTEGGDESAETTAARSGPPRWRLPWRRER
jgi:hypothetical protein